jgi:DNA-binding NtrC family response regulator
MFAALPAPTLKVSPAIAARSQFARVLAICPRPEDRVRLHEILQRQGPTICDASTWQEGSAELRRNRPQVVICEATLPDADWKTVLGETASRSEAPRLIVISSQADESLWAEVLNLGGYDLLPKPLVEDEVVRVVDLAWQNWKNERERARRRA